MSLSSDRYKQAGVDIEAGMSLAGRLREMAAGLPSGGQIAGIGGFASVFDLKQAGFHDPLLVASADGVGTRLLLAAESGALYGTGIDLVAMCVNDLVVQGARPLFFLDYYATPRLETGQALQVMAGIIRGCAMAGCVLSGGETAEMPGMYQPGHYELAGFCVGGVERDKLVGADTIASIGPGDVILALPSSGLHASGFSLVRKIVADLGLPLSGPAPFDPGQRLDEALLVPTAIYVAPLLRAAERGLVKAAAHITGGGLIENLPRVLPRGVEARLEGRRWQPWPVFSWLRQEGKIDSGQMARIFNCGLGMLLVTSREMRPDLETALAGPASMTGEGETPPPLAVGEIVAAAPDSPPRVVIDWSGSAWADG